MTHEERLSVRKFEFSTSESLPEIEALSNDECALKRQKLSSVDERKYMDLRFLHPHF